jgi:CRP/FNR family transcriptional regulator, dissimilatory nitrate respiration regulator
MEHAMVPRNMNIPHSHSQTDTPQHVLFQAHPEAWHALAGYVRKQAMGRNMAVFCHGDSARSLYLLVSGWVKLTRQTPDGKETIIGLCTEGDLLGEAALFPNANYPCNAETLADTELLAIPAETLRATLAKDQAFSAHIMRLLNERVAQTQLKLEQMNTMSASQRLGCFLLRLCHTQAHGEKTIEIPIEKHILAAYLGMKPETLSRSQLQLKQAGVATAGHTITIGNIAKLREFVCNSCSESGSCDAEIDD